jgi:hypothetical protein
MISRSGRCPTHDALAARLGLEIGMAAEEVGHLRLDRLCEQGMRPVAQNLGERIGEGPWLSQLDNVSVGHGVSLLWWRSGGVKHPHDTPPHPFMPSPTSAHSSVSRWTIKGFGEGVLNAIPERAKDFVRYHSAISRAQPGRPNATGICGRYIS